MRAKQALHISGGSLALLCQYEDRERVKTVPGYQWDKKESCWRFPIRPETVDQLKSLFPEILVSYEVGEMVERIRSREKKVLNEKMQDLDRAFPVATMPVKTFPMPQQVVAFNVGMALPRFALLMEQGTGKSLSLISIMGRRFLDGEIKRVLIIAPSSVVPVWTDSEIGELALHANFPYKAVPLRGEIKKRIEFLKAWKPTPGVLQIAVINYEATWRSGMEEALAAWRPDLIACDESQHIKSPGAEQSKAIVRLGRGAKYRAILTGTPVTQGPLDFFGQYKFLEQSIFGPSMTSFRNRYTITETRRGTNGEFKQILAYKNLEELVQKAHAIAYRCTKVDAKMGLPEFVDQRLYYNLDKKSADMYKTMVRESIMLLESGDYMVASNVLAKALRLSQLCGGFAGEHGNEELVNTGKLSLLSNTLDDLLTIEGKKVVIFARFTPEIRAIRNMVIKKDLGYALISGEVSAKQREFEIREFAQNPECRVFIGQIETAQQGLNLTEADTMIFYSATYNFADYDQARARIHRKGQKNACTYIHLLAAGTIDEKVLRVLRNKKDLAHMVVDNWREVFEWQPVEE